MPELTCFQNILAVWAGMVLGMLFAIAGSGGALLAIPLMFYVVRLKNPHIVLATAAAVITATAIIGALSQARQGPVQWKHISVITLTGMGGMTVGRLLGDNVSTHVMLLGIGALMLINAVILVPALGTPAIQDQDGQNTVHWARMIPIGLAIGMIGGVFGVGGGFLVFPGLIAVGMPMASALGTSLISTGTMNVANLMHYAVAGTIDWRVVADYVLGSVIGTQVIHRVRVLSSRGRVAGWLVIMALASASLLLMGTTLHHILL